MEQRVVTKSVSATRRLARLFASKLKTGETVGLAGELGSGKTTFVQGIADYFGIGPQVSSPTFVLVQEYKIVTQNAKCKMQSLAIRSLVHIDCYRLDKPQELLDIGFSDYLKRKDIVVLIEWAEKVRNILPPSTKWIYFAHGKQENQRVIRILSSLKL